MEQKQIGEFIAQCRKEKGLTQLQLAEALGITNQAVSKWENGRGMPDISLLQPLCDILDISLNELFSGKHLSAEEYKISAEKNISSLFRESQTAKRKPIKYLFSTLSNVSLIVASIELLIGCIAVFFDSTTCQVMLANALVWMIFFCASITVLQYEKMRLKRHKTSGICLEAEIEDLLPSTWCRVGNYTTCKVVCRFYCEGKQYKAISNYYVISPFIHKEDLYACVYCNKHNPLDCSVVLYQ